MTYSIETLLEELMQFDVITFDIFDTLITRRVLRPVDVFWLVEKEAINQHNVKKDFFKERQLAEQIAYKNFHDDVTLDCIYNVLRKNYQYTFEECSLLKRLEIECEEELIIPRNDILDIVKKLYNEKKKIIFISDMYLTSDIVKILLCKCGYPTDIPIWISCEKSASKRNGSLWNDFFQIYENKKTIHLGDNLWADIKQVQSLGRKAIMIDNPYELFVKSPFYSFLSKYENKEISNNLLLGILINEICFNSSFGDISGEKMAVGLWMGAVFGCFMNWLVNTADESILLFVTREGYILLPLYEAYCETLGVQPQKHCLFYASRTATTAATLISKEDIQDVLKIRYTGTLKNLIKSRLNSVLPIKNELLEKTIELPIQKENVFKLLEPYYQIIIENSKIQNLAYQEYVKSIREEQGHLPLTIVDVGYTGTAQYNLSKILHENISGKYIFLDEFVLPKRLGCSCESVAKVTDRVHPIYENLLFLEAAMQVSFGQLKKVSFDKNKQIIFDFGEDKHENRELEVAQDLFLKFVQFEAKWEKKLGTAFRYDFNLAEDVWIIMIQYDILPKNLVKCFWLSDEFLGSEKWQYFSNEHKWKTGEKGISVIFPLLSKKKNMKYNIKNFVKKNVPDILYECFRYIWVKYIK